MGISPILKWAPLFLVLFVGALILTTNPASAVADLNVNVTSGTQTLGGATVSLTFPDGSTVERTDDDDDGAIAIVLRDPGRYSMTITTPDGQSRTTSFNAPSSGSVTVNYDAASTAAPRVSVNDTSSATPRSSGRAPSSQFSGSIFGNYGTSSWDTQILDSNGSELFNGEDGKMRKWGIGFGLRYTFGNYPIFVENRFYYHARGRFRDPIDVSSYNFFARERWKNQMLFGWHIRDGDDFKLSALAGISLAKVQLEVLGSSTDLNNSEVQVAPVFGFEGEIPIRRNTNIWWVFGSTATIMNGFSIEEQSQNEIFRIDNDLQWDIHTGLRVPF